MAEEVIKADEPVTEHSADEPKVDDVDSKINKAIEGVETRFKSEISGLNRRNTELEKELEAEKAAHMTDKERLEYEQEQKNKDLADRELRLAEAERRNMITNGLAEKKLDLSVSELMTVPKTPEEMAAWTELFNSIVNAQVEGRVKEILPGTPPKSGITPTLVKPLNTKEDAMRATEEEALAYLTQEIAK